MKTIIRFDEAAPTNETLELIYQVALEKGMKMPVIAEAIMLKGNEKERVTNFIDCFLDNIEYQFHDRQPHTDETGTRIDKYISQKLLIDLKKYIQNDK